MSDLFGNHIVVFSTWLISCFSDRGVYRTEVMRGSLHYLFDAVMPFLQVSKLLDIAVTQLR